jgi:hypothetical protein
MSIISVFISMLHMLQWLYTYVASACFKCFIYSRRMLQQSLHVASVFISRHGKGTHAECVHLYVAYVAIAIHVCFNCFKRMLQVFI